MGYFFLWKMVFWKQEWKSEFGSGAGVFDGGIYTVIKVTYGKGKGLGVLILDASLADFAQNTHPLKKNKE